MMYIAMMLERSALVPRTWVSRLVQVDGRKHELVRLAELLDDSFRTLTVVNVEVEYRLRNGRMGGRTQAPAAGTTRQTASSRSESPTLQGAVTTVIGRWAWN